MDAPAVGCRTRRPPRGVWSTVTVGTRVRHAAGVRRDAAPSGEGASVSGRIRATSGRRRRSSATASGVCSRTMNRPAWLGTRDRVSRLTTTIVTSAAGTLQAAGWPRSTASQPVASRWHEGVPDGRAGPEPTDQQPGHRADVGEPPPPDAEQQQRAERRGGDREREPDGAGDADVRAWRAPARQGTTTATAAPTRKAATPPSRRSPNRRPVTSWLSTPATAMARPDEVERNAANAPAVTSPVSSSPPGPGHHQPRQLEHQRVGPAGLGQLRGVDAPEGAVQRREQVEDAEQPEHHERGPAGGPAVGVGVEADHHVREAHGAEERGDDQGVGDVEPLRRRPRRAGSTTGRRRCRRRRPGWVPRRPPRRRGAPAIGISRAVSFSQYWKACTKVMLRIPPEVTLASTTRATITAPSQSGAPMVAVRVTLGALELRQQVEPADRDHEQRADRPHLARTPAAPRRSRAACRRPSGAAERPRGPAARGSRRSSRRGTRACRRRR